MPSEAQIRYGIASALLQAEAPLTLERLVETCGLGEAAVAPVLEGLMEEGLVVATGLAPGRPGPCYWWGARWQAESQQRSAQSRSRLRRAVGRRDANSSQSPEMDSEPVLAFYEHVLHEYEPPKGKRFLVFLQCSVRRPSSSSPSHAALRRAIATATGSDPRWDFERCPVHVVVLASKVGPVPYDLEDVYPANVRGRGVERFVKKEFARAKPVLAGRMAGYLIAHGRRYERMAAFTARRHGEVMRQARAAVGMDLPIFPVLGGTRIVRMGGAPPRNYWEKYWIQLHLEVASWLDANLQRRAAQRLEELEVEFSSRDDLGQP